VTRGIVEDVFLLLLIAFLLPLSILLLGTPLALAGRVVIELAHRFL
jgi:hypothetical protein